MAWPRRHNVYSSQGMVAYAQAPDDEADAPLAAHTGTALLLRHLWLRASSRRELWDYLSALHTRHGPVLLDAADGSLEALEHDWMALPPFGADELAGPAVLEAAMTSFAESDDGSDNTRAAASFEVLAAALALGGSRAAPLNQGRYSFRDQPPVADCAELCARASHGATHLSCLTA